MHLRCSQFPPRFRPSLICVAHRSLSTSFSFSPTKFIARSALSIALLASFSGALTAADSVALAAQDSPASSAAIPKGPYLQDLGATSVVVRFELANAAPAKLEVSEASADAGTDAKKSHARSFTFDDASVTAMHSIRASRLESKTNYDYVVHAAGQSMRGTFTTAPNADSVEPFSFVLYGDNRTDEVAHAAVVRAISSAPADFLIHTGDFVQDGASPRDWQSFFDIESSLLRNRCVFSCVGNHELTEANGASYLRYFAPTQHASGPLTASRDGGLGAREESTPNLYGSFRWGNARFFMLNAMDAWDSGAERSWLDSELAKSDDETGLIWRVVVLHHSPWSAGPHGGNPRMLRAQIPSIFAKHKVDLVVAGHDHIYERGFADGLRYLISGGGGAPLYRVEAPLVTTRKVESVHHFVEATVSPVSIELAATRVDGTLIEKCAFTKSSASWDCDPKPQVAVVQPASVASVVSASASSNDGKSSGSRCGCRVVGEGEGRERPAENRAYLLASCLAAIAIVGRRRAR